MKTIILFNPECSKCQAAMNTLEENHCDIEVIEYLKDVPTAEELRSIIQKLGIKPEELLRKKEALFQEQYLDKNLSDEEWIRVMVENPVLIERPVIIRGNTAVIGRDEERLAKILEVKE